MIAIIKASRPTNLLIVGLTQYLFYHIFFVQYQDDFDLSLYPSLIYPFISVTVLIAAGGYYINDYFDSQSDTLNSKSNRLSNKYIYLCLYFLTFVLGWIISYRISAAIDKLGLSIIYLIATGLLFIYSSHLKKSPLIGNVVVAAFSSFVLLIVVYSEIDIFRNPSWQLSALDGIALSIIGFYSIYIFLLSLLRELVKDMEDISGDRDVEYRTFPIVYGINKSKGLSVLLSIVLLSLSIFWILYCWNILSISQHSWFLVSILLPNFFLIYKVYHSTDRKDYSFISRLCKLLMFSGLIYIIVIAWI